MEVIKRVEGSIKVDYRHSYGNSLTKFFAGTKNKIIYGARCTKCKKISVPAVIICGKCFAVTEDEWISLNQIAVLRAYTIVLLPFPGQPKEPPYVWGMLRFEDASTDFPHLVEFEDLELKPFTPLDEINKRLKIGMKVKAVWNEKRCGDLYDIKYFLPVKE